MQILRISKLALKCCFVFLLKIKQQHLFLIKQIYSSQNLNFTCTINPWLDRLTFNFPFIEFIY